MSAYDAVKAWVYSGGDELAPRTFREGLDDRQLATRLLADWPNGWSSEQCLYSLDELTSGFAELRKEMEVVPD